MNKHYLGLEVGGLYELKQDLWALERDHNWDDILVTKGSHLFLINLPDIHEVDMTFLFGTKILVFNRDCFKFFTKLLWIENL